MDSWTQSARESPSRDKPDCSAKKDDPLQGSVLRLEETQDDPRMGSACSICLTDLSTKKDDNYQLNCQHIYHRECISEWLKYKNTCPLCRASIDPSRRYVEDNIITDARLWEIMGEVGLSISKTFISRLDQGLERAVNYTKRRIISQFSPENIYSLMNSSSFDEALSDISTLILQGLESPENNDC